MKVNRIYSTFNGEANPYGIGSLTAFLRLQGCHIRCYAKTMGILCDTPEGLSAEGGTEMSVEDIIAALNMERIYTGSSLVCLTGGDPLWRKKEDLHSLFDALGKYGFRVTVETSGTLDPIPYIMYNHVSFILDYKTSSAGVKGNIVPKIAPLLRSNDYIKFVIATEEDFVEMLDAMYKYFGEKTKAKVTAGIFWGEQGKLTTFQIFDRLQEQGMLHYLTGGINLQAHKAVMAPNFQASIPEAR